MERKRVAITTVPGPRTARVTTVDRLAELLDALERFGPEPEGIVVDVDAAALEAFPPAWTWEPVNDDVEGGDGNGAGDSIDGP